MSEAMSLTRRPIPRFDRGVWAMLAGIFIGTLGTATVASYAALFLRQRVGISPTQIGVILSVSGLALAVGQIGIAPLAARFGRKFAFVIALLSESAAALVFVAARDIPLALLCLVWMSASWGAQQSVGNSLLADLVTTNDRIEAFGWQRSSFLAASALGPILGGVLFARWPLAIMLADAGATVLFAALIVAIVRLPDGFAAADRAEVRSLYPTVVRDRRFMTFCFLLGLAAFGPIQRMTTLPLFLTDRLGLSAATFGWLLGAVLALGSGVQLLVTQWIRSFSIQRRCTFGVAAFAGAFTTLAAVAHLHRDGMAVGPPMLAGIALAIAIQTIGEMILLPTASAFVADRATAPLRPAYFAILGIAFNLGGFGGPILGSTLQQHLPADVGWLVLAALMGSTAGVFWVIVGRQDIENLDDTRTAMTTETMAIHRSDFDR